MWSQSVEKAANTSFNSPQAIFNSRCNNDSKVSTALASGSSSLALTWILQVFMLWKCKGIKESLGLVKEIKTTAILCIIVGIIGAASGPTSVRKDLIVDPFFFMNVLWILGLSYSSFWIPISAARAFRNAKREKTVSSEKIGDSEPSKQDISVKERDCYNELLNALRKMSQTPEAFKSFLCEEFALENYLFLEAVSKLKASPSSSELSQLWVNYIEAGSTYEVNLPAGGRKNFKIVLEKLMENPSSVELLLDVLKALCPLEEEIFRLVKNGALFRFKFSLNIPSPAEVATAPTATENL
jgi:hypothetical protein